MTEAIDTLGLTAERCVALLDAGEISVTRAGFRLPERDRGAKR